MANLTILNKISATCPIFDIVAPAGLTNGNIVVLGSQNTNKTYACAANSAVTDKSMVLVAAVCLPYEVEKLENDYTIATGEVVRAYTPYVGMVASFPAANFTPTAAIAKDKVIVPKAGALKMECLAAPAGTEAVVFVIDEVFTKAGVAMIKIRCIKA